MTSETTKLRPETLNEILRLNWPKESTNKKIQPEALSQLSSLVESLIKEALYRSSNEAVADVMLNDALSDNSEKKAITLQVKHLEAVLPQLLLDL